MSLHFTLCFYGYNCKTWHFSIHFADLKHIVRFPQSMAIAWHLLCVFPGFADICFQCFLNYPAAAHFVLGSPRNVCGVYNKKNQLPENVQMPYCASWTTCSCSDLCNNNPRPQQIHLIMTVKQ